MKPYTWEEIKELLIKELKKTKHILTFGTIGSCNVEHDVDLIITKKPKSKSSDFYKEIHNLFDLLNKYLNNKYGAKVIRFSQYEEEAKILSDYKEKDLAFHTMVYTSYPQIEKDWGWFLLENESIKEILLSCNCLLGSTEDLFSKEFKKESYYDSIFIILYLYDRVNSNYPEKRLVEVMNACFDLIFRKKLGRKTPIAKNKKEVREIFYKLCDIIDKLNKKK